MLVSKVNINRQGYESRTGKYYGVGLPVYRATDKETGEVLYEGRHATRAEAVKAASLKARRNPHRKGHIRRTLGARPARKMTTKVKLYYSVLIPYTTVRPTQWHPTSPSFAPLARGSFKSAALAHAWAAKHLGPGAKYSLRRYRGA